MGAAETNARMAVAEQFAHCLGCHSCGDTDYECEVGRGLRVAAMTVCGEIGPRAYERICSLAMRADVAPYMGPKAATAMIYRRLFV